MARRLGLVLVGYLGIWFVLWVFSRASGTHNPVAKSLLSILALLLIAWLIFGEFHHFLKMVRLISRLFRRTGASLGRGRPRGGGSPERREPRTMACPRCRAEIPVSGRFCVRCGTALT